MNSSNIYHLREQNPTNKVKVTRMADYVVDRNLGAPLEKKKHYILMESSFLPLSNKSRKIINTKIIFFFNLKYHFGLH